jgi:hypothetical protein
MVQQATVMSQSVGSTDTLYADPHIHRGVKPYPLYDKTHPNREAAMVGETTIYDHSEQQVDSEV